MKDLLIGAAYGVCIGVIVVAGCVFAVDAVSYMTTMKEHGL